MKYRREYHIENMTYVPHRVSPPLRFDMYIKIAGFTQGIM